MSDWPETVVGPAALLDNIAGPTAFLLSHDARYISGDSLVAGGGPGTPVHQRGMNPG